MPIVKGEKEMSNLKRHRSVQQHVDCSHVILDIEGTTTSITFVKDTLFPYVKEHLETYLSSNWKTQQCEDDVNALRVQSRIDVESDSDSPVISQRYEDMELCIKQVIAYTLSLMAKDKKITALKQLQGHIWKAGYDSGELRGHVYPDVVPSLKRWKSKDKNMYIYSSGSVAAQKLIFGFSVEGDLLHYFSGHYDTNIGGKLEAESYTKIAADIGVAASQCLFITDNVKEARAAKVAGMQVLVSRRPGNQVLTEEDLNEFTIIDSFDDVDFSTGNNEPAPKRIVKET